MTISNQILRPRGWLDAYDRVILADKPTGYWKMNEAGGTTVYDLSGNQNHGTMTGGVAKNQQGPWMGSASMGFTSGAGYITAGTADAWIANGSMSLEVWANIPPDPIGYGFLAGIRDGSNGEFYILQLQNSNTLETRFTNSAGTKQDFDGQPNIPTWTPNAWYHGALVYDAAAQTLTFYSNGQPVASRSATGSITTSGIPFWIGGQGSTTDNNFRGYEGFVATFAHALTPNRVLAHYNAGRTGIRRP